MLYATIFYPFICVYRFCRYLLMLRENRTVFVRKKKILFNILKYLESHLILKWRSL